MDTRYEHKPVLLNEVCDYLVTDSSGTYVDCTVGLGGHSAEILKRLSVKGKLVAIDRDADSLAKAKEKLKFFKDRVFFAHSSYRDLRRVLSDFGIVKVNGVLLDLGYSSYQIDDPSRGFSFTKNGPLDMRYDRTKGITAASLGQLLKSRGLKVTIQKFDPYINVDPGTLSPYQHGEVFVTEDGAETDLDLGHYERFIDENLTKNNSVTTGSVYWSVISKERKGDYEGKTVQVIPHITNEIKERIVRTSRFQPFDVVITEIGGTVGDIESLPFMEAIRQIKYDVGK
mgnify:CR=1 FL=1